MDGRREPGLSLDPELENYIKNESSEVGTITGKSKKASPDLVFVAVQGSGSSSPHGGLCVPVRWLCFMDFHKLSLTGWGGDRFLMFVHWPTKYDNTSGKWTPAFCWARRGGEFKWHLWMLGRCPEGQAWRAAAGKQEKYFRKWSRRLQWFSCCSRCSLCFCITL